MVPIAVEKEKTARFGCAGHLAFTTFYAGQGTVPVLFHKGVPSGSLDFVLRM